MQQYEYTLQRYGGMRTRYTCPNCGRKRCFTLYVDINGEPLDETVGRCDHESSCGYHYTPKEYFQDHPSASRDWRNLSNMLRRNQRPMRQSQNTKEPDTIPTDIVQKTIRPDIPSHLSIFLTGLLGAEAVKTLTEKYRLGVTKSRSIIYWQIDSKNRVRTGKIMKYDSSTGHRIKEESTTGRIDWIHSQMKRSGQLPENWQLTQCLFGEHLLPQNPSTIVALVESEKTALICAALMPEYFWLATGGKSQLSEERLKVLKGRTVIAFPDIDGHDTWKAKLGELNGYCITVSDYLEKNATPEQRAAHIDIADLLIQQLIENPQQGNTHHCEKPVEQTTWQSQFRQIRKYISEEWQNNVEEFIEEFRLMPTRISFS